MKINVTCAHWALKTKVLVGLFTFILCLIGTNSAWAATWKKGGVKIVSSGTTLTVSAIDPEGEGTRGVMADYEDFDDGSLSSSVRRPATWSYSFTDLVIEDGVTVIGAHAFQSCTTIKNIKVPTSLTTFNSEAFKGCTAMEKIYYEGSPNQWAVIDFADQTAHPFGALSTSKDYYFYGNTSTKTSTLVFFPPLTQIKQYTFQRINLNGTGNGLSIPGTVATIGNYAFYGCVIEGEFAINRKVSPTMGTDAFRGIGTSRKLYVPSGATGYRTSGANWNFSLTQISVSGSTLGTYGTDITWKLSEDGVLTLDASNTATKNITLSAAASLPWRYFRRLVYKVVLKGDISALNSTLRYHYGFSEVILHQQTLPTVNSTYIGGTNYASLFNTKDKLTLRIPPELDGAAGLSSAPWNDATHWNVVVTDYCADPSGLTASKTGATTAAASWTDDRGSAWKYLCLPAATELTEGMWSSAASTTSKSVVITSLTPATTYKFYLIADCDAVGTSDVLVSDEFTTDCGAIAHTSLPWSEGFESCTNNVKPVCWEQLVNGTSKIYAKKLAGDAHAGNFSLCLSGGKTSQTIVTAIFPEFDDDITNLSLSFWYKTNVNDEWYTYGQPQIGYISDIDDPLTFEGVGSALAQNGSYVHIENVTFPAEASGARIAIQYTGGSDNGYVYLDDITIDVKPSCNKPTGVSAGSETAEGATITWNANDMSAWKLQVSEGDAASWGDEISAATNSKVLTGLKANTLYYVRVKADCGGGSVSDWSDNVSFTTLCGTISVTASSSWNEDFEALSDNTIPDCWDNSSSTTTSSWGDGYIWGANSYSDNHVLRMDNSVLDGGTALINTPSISIPNDGREYELTFDYKNMALNSGNLIVKVSANGGAFTQVGSYSNTNGTASSYPGEMHSATISLADYNNMTIKIQFYATPNSGTSSADGVMFVDNVSVHKVPTCFAPTALTFGNLTANSARISWTKGGEESAWRLQYRTTDGSWSDEVVVSSNPYTLSGLTADTEYIVRVKSYCSADDQSEWSETGSFTTLCTAASMPFEESFSSASALPDCWVATSTVANTYKWSAYENSGAYSAQLRTGSSGEAELRLPPISLSEDAILRFEWKNANGANVNVYISTDGGTTKTLLANDLSGVHSDWTTKIIDLSDYTGETALIYFKSLFSTANQYAYLDDVEVLARPCDLILNIQAAPVNDGATISWSGNVKKLQYKTGSADWTSVTIAPGDYAGPKAISGLTPARTYQVRLLPACSEDQEANYTTPVYFTSNAIESVPYYNDFESEAVGEVPFNWSRISSSEYPQVSYDMFAYVAHMGDRGNSVKFTGVNDQILVLPEFDTELQDLYISLHYINRDCTMELGYVASDGLTFTAIVTLPSQTSYGEYPYEKVLKNLSASAYKLAIRYRGATGVSSQAWVDNVRVDVPTCGQPESLTLGTVTASSAYLSWEESELGTETRYQYILRTWSADDPNWTSATLLDEDVREVSRSGLTANTDYEFYLRSYCDASHQSTPVRLEFKTELRDEVFEDVASATNNETRLEALIGQTLNVTINRPLLLNGDYCTLTLPFALSTVQLANVDCPLNGFVIKQFESSEEEEGVVNVYLNEVNAIEAGKPYFVRYAGEPSDDRLTPLVFRNVTIACSTPAAIDDDGFTPHGVFNPYPLVADDATTLFLSSNNTLYYPSANGTMNGFRAYVKVDEGMSAPIRRGVPIRICESKNTATDVSGQQSEVSTQKVLRDGQLLIIRDGKTYNAQGLLVR